MKPLPGKTPVVETRLSLEDDVQSCLERLHVTNIHDGIVRVLEQVVPATRNINVTRDLVLKKWMQTVN